MPKIEAQSPASRRTQPHATPTYFEALSIADCLAQKFVANFPSKREEPEWRHYFRSFCIPGLRWLWRTGDATTRTTLAARVAVWRELKSEEVQTLQARIRTRELARVEGGAL